MNSRLLRVMGIVMTLVLATTIFAAPILAGGEVKGDVDIKGTIAKILYPDGKTVLKIDFGGMHPIKVLVTDETDIDAEGKLMVGDMVRVRAEFVKTCLTATDITVLD